MASNSLAKSVFFCVILISMVFAFASSLQFDVGGSKGWKEPSGKFSYNDWASRNRFHVGDSLYFKYINDSVLVVDKMSYKNCSASKPVFKFQDGETAFKLDRFGYFYFVSGESSHCKSGQKLIVRVMVHPAATAPAFSPEGSGSEGGDGWNHPKNSSSFKLNVASYFVSVIVGFLVVLYLLM